MASVFMFGFGLVAGSAFSALALLVRRGCHCLFVVTVRGAAAERARCWPDESPAADAAVAAAAAAPAAVTQGKISGLCPSKQKARDDRAEKSAHPCAQ